ncbi:MAG: hypothetical protein C0444_03155 [Microbacterium sp.]|nr:hypothetical protein [Microbacterium sp.]MBA4345630.1 hypothetical protein [Microbacterium sp.]
MVVEMSAGGPERIQIVPDDYHTEHVGVTPDGLQVFATSELFEVVGVRQMRFFAAAFVWNAQGEFERLEVRDVSRESVSPPGQGVASDEDMVETLLSELGGIELTPISVAPFAAEWEGITFGFVYLNEDGYERVELHPGNGIAFSEPWDGYGYDT